MSKKKSKSKNVTVKSLSPESLAQSAASFYSSGDYKNALSRYERLYKECPDESNKKQLIACLLARSKQLAQKQMYVEACALFANLQERAPESLPIHDYLNCLIKAHYYEKAYALCCANKLDEHSISPEDASWLLAAAMVHTKKIAPSAELFQQKIALAQDVLRMLDTEPSESLRFKLKKISLRSPLKDLRLLIHSLLLFQTHQAESLKLAKEIKATSPFFAIAQVLVIACLQPIDLFLALADLSTLQLTLLQQLKGWSKEQLDTLGTASAILLKQQNPLKKIKFILQLKAVPDELIKQVCLSLYDGNAVQWKLVTERFGEEPFVRTKVKALQTEKRDKPWDCIKPWDECIDALKQSKSLPKELIGLIRLHQYQVISTRCCPEHEECIHWLIDSLGYLPSRKATYMELCMLYDRAGNKKLHEKWLNTMQKQFPDDIGVLLNTATHCLEKKTYTKAIKMLQTALEVDSINTQAKQLLTQAYFEKALHELGKKKAKNAAMDIKNASSFQQYLHALCFIPIAESFLAFCNADLAIGKEQLVLAYQKAESKLFVNYMVMYYITVFKINAPGLQDALIWDRADETALVSLIKGLKEIHHYVKHQGQKKLLILDAHEPLRKQVGSALKGVVSYDEFELLCRLFLDLKWYTSLLLAAKSALKIHKKSGLFHYYQIKGEIKGDVRVLTSKQYQALIDSLEHLPEQERTKATPLIASLLDEAERYRKPSFLDFPFLGGMPKNVSDFLDELFV